MRSDNKKPLSQGKRRAMLSYALLALGIVLVALGVWGGGIAGVIAKAVAICSECIGLG